MNCLIAAVRRGDPPVDVAGSDAYALEAAAAITSSVDWPITCAVLCMEARVGALFHNTFVRYLFTIATVASTFALRLWQKRANDEIKEITQRTRAQEAPQVRTDIEQMKRIEQELKDANAFLDAVIENIPLTVFIKESRSLRFVWFNRAGEDLLGWPRQTFIGKTVSDLWPRAQAEFFIEKDRETLNSGKVVDIPEEPVETRHQGIRFVHTKKVPICNAAGQAIYLLGISEDITERRRIEQERQFLAEASVALSASLDYEQTLATVAQLVVRDFADWCIVDIMEEQDNLLRLKVASANPANAALCARLQQVPVDRNRPYLVRAAIEKRQPLLLEHVTSEYLESVAQSTEHLEALRSISPTSIIGSAAPDARTTPWSDRVRLLHLVPGVRSGRSSPGPGAGGSSGGGNRECAALPRLGPCHPAP